MMDSINYIRDQLEAGVSYVILPNALAADLSGRIMQLERDNKMLRSEIEILQRMRHAGALN